MGFDEWWESFWEPTEGFRSVNLKDIARTAWEAAQAQDKDVVGEIKEMWAEYPSLRDEFAMAALSGMLSLEVSRNHSDRKISRLAYRMADAMLKERER